MHPIWRGPQQCGPRLFFVSPSRRTTGAFLTLYRLYTENGNRAGFWVQHRDWNNRCARVRSIDGQESGRLPGSSPLYNEAKIVVDCFDVRSGRPLTADAFDKPVTDRKFIPIAQPAWY
jgi:hypothetical protein